MRGKTIYTKIYIECPLVCYEEKKLNTAIHKNVTICNLYFNLPFLKALITQSVSSWFNNETNVCKKKYIKCPLVCHEGKDMNTVIHKNVIT